MLENEKQKSELIRITTTDILSCASRSQNTHPLWSCSVQAVKVGNKNGSNRWRYLKTEHVFKKNVGRLCSHSQRQRPSRNILVLIIAHRRWPSLPRLRLDPQHGEGGRWASAAATTLGVKGVGPHRHHFRTRGPIVSAAVQILRERWWAPMPRRSNGRGSAAPCRCADLPEAGWRI